MEFAAGTRLGPFLLERALGKGGMGEVYAAVDTRNDHVVALKVLGAKMNVEPHRRRFLREGDLAARMKSAQIAEIFEVGEADGRPYIVMELLEGRSLRALLADRRPSIETCITIIRDVARALAFAHAHEVVHRDIKPESVFVVEHDGQLVAKVLDFGLARDDLARNRGDEDATATDAAGPGEALGTAGYLAPEQARGQVVDARADVFSSGVVLYEMLTGKRAFDGRNALARMLAVVKHHPEPIHFHLAEVSTELEEIVERCLAKAPEDRYANGTELLRALDHVAAHPEEPTRPVLPAFEEDDRTELGEPPDFREYLPVEDVPSATSLLADLREMLAVSHVRRALVISGVVAAIGVVLIVLSLR